MWLGAVLLLTAGVACSEDTMPAVVTRETPIVPLDTGTVWIASGATTYTVSVEIAETRDQQAFGLMERDHLPEDEGMIFVYDSLREGGFYMFRTRIPLDIAFYDEDGRIVSIFTMPPCTAPNPRMCDVYEPEERYVGALEMIGGYFASRGIGVGDRIELTSRGGL